MHRNDRDHDERNRGEFPGEPFSPRHGFGGPWARDTHREGLGDDYASDLGWSGAGRHDDYTREQPSFRGRGPKNWRRSDERIRELISERLTDADEVDATDIEVTVQDAEVTLSGRVTSRREKRIAEDLAWACGGVQDVHNRLRLDDRETHLGKASE
jgi:osmotically-inducible protein OsmY